MATGIEISVTEDVTTVTVAEDVTTIDITPSVTTVEAKGIALGSAGSASATAYQNSNTNLAVGATVKAALDHVNTNGFSKTLGGTVAGATDFTSTITFTGAADFNNTVSFVSNIDTDLALDSTKRITWGSTGGGNLQYKFIKGTDGANLELGTGETTTMYIRPNGNVGIGVAIPTSTLDVNGEITGTALDINGNADVSGNFVVDTNTLYVDSTNNEVGINNSTPSTALDVTGTITGTGLDINGNADVHRLTVAGDTGTAVITLHDSTDDDDHVIYLTGLVNGATENIFSLGTNDSTNQFQMHSWLDRDFEFTFGSDKHVDAVATISTSGLDVVGEITASEKVESPLFKGDLEGAVHFKASGSGLAKGDVVYISGYAGQRTTVAKADASDSAKMPAFGIVNATQGNNNVDVLTFGSMLSLSTIGIATGTELFVSATTPGGYETSAPTGEGNLIQKIAKVVRGESASGSIKIMGAGRTNATPNLNDGNIFIGNSSNIPTTASFDTTFASSFATRFIDEDDMSSNSATKAPSQQSVKAYVASQISTKDNTDEITEGSTNLYFTNDRADARVTALAVLDSEVDADIKTLSLPANTTISTYGKSLVDDTDAATARGTLGLGTAATTASTDYVAASSLSAFGGTLIDDADAATARGTLGLGTAATTASTDYATSAQGSTADSALQPGDVVDNLTSTSTTAPLSAAQGKALEDNKQDNLTFGISDDNAVEIDGTATNGDVAVFTANGITSSADPTVDTITLEDSSHWQISVNASNQLVFSFNGVAKMTLTSSGMLTVDDNIVAYGTP